MSITLSELPNELLEYISEFLTGPELACLNWVSQGFNDFCNEIKFYNKFNSISNTKYPTISKGMVSIP